MRDPAECKDVQGEKQQQIGVCIVSKRENAGTK